jgi:WD40 repeat protein
MVLAPSAVALPRTLCERAHDERARVPKLLAAGKLDRTVRVIERADRLCPRDAKESADVLVDTLVELGRWEEAMSAASSASKEAAARARARAKSAVAEKGPSPEALWTSGLEKKVRGETADAQRHLDRAVVALERTLGASLELDVPNGFAGHVNAVAFAPDGRTLAVAHRTALSLVDSVTLRESKRLRGHSLPITAVAWAPSGKVVVTGSRDETLRVWDPETGLEVRRFVGLLDGVNALAFAPGGKRFASAGSDGTIRLWDPESATERARIDAKAGAALSVSLGADEKLVLAGYHDGAARVLRVADGAVVAKLDGGGPVRAVVLGPKAQWAAIAGTDETVRIFAVPSGKLLRKLEGHGGPVGALVLSADGASLASASADQTVRVWDAATGVPSKVLDGHAVMALAVAFSPDGTRLASGSYGTLHLWDAASGKETARIAGHALPIHAIAMSSDTAMLATGSTDGVVRLWSSPGAPKKLEGHLGSIEALAFSADGALLASASLDRTAHLWDSATGVDRGALDGVGVVRSLSFSPDARVVTTGAPDAGLLTWDAATRKLRNQDPISTRGFARSPDGARLAIAAAGASIVLRDSLGIEIARMTGHTGPIEAVAFSPDGKVVASGSADKTIRIWDASNGHAIARLEGHGDAVVALAFRPSADSWMLFSGSSDGSVRAWDSSGQQTMKLGAQLEPLTAIVVGGSRRWLSTVARDGTVVFWSLPEAQLRASLRIVAGRDAAYVFAPSGEIEIFGEASELPVCRVAATTVPFALCEERFTSPGLLARILADEELAP